MDININSEQPKFHVVTVTIREVYAAFEKNGMEHIRGAWYQNGAMTQDGDFIETKGCIMAQGAKNLNTFGSDTNYTSALGSAYYKATSVFGAFGSYADITVLDDLNNKRYNNNLHSQLNRYRIAYDSPWFDSYEGPMLGNTIIAWNDKYDVKGDYTLSTWEDVLAMAKDVMTPFFDETVDLLQYS